MSDNVNVNLDNLLCVMLLELRKHLNKCRLCSAALEANQFDMVCEPTKRMIVNIGRKWDRLIPDRLVARRGDKSHIYPCPDIGKHGKAYAMTAEIVYVEGIETPLF